MNSERRHQIYRTIMLIILVAVITFILTTILIYNVKGEEKYIYVSGNDGGISSTLSSFRKIIDKKFLGEINEQNLINGAIKGYIDGLNDPYTEYFTKEEMDEFNIDVTGNFVGIGVYLTKDIQKNAVIIISPIKDTPAYEAGLLPGDIITKVDDISYTGEQLTEASNKIKGEEGTNVKLEVQREDQTLTFNIIRKTVKVNHVESKVINNNIGYIKLNTFDEGCSDEFKQKLEDLKSKNIKSLIIDIRNNGGGIVDEAINIADFMTSKDVTLLITVDKNNNEKITKSKENAIIDMPIVVLTNKNTASASEILAGALKENSNAKIIGTKTYGKGVIQELLTLSDGSGLKITTNEYYTPNRNKINEIGIKPDEEIKLAEELENKLEMEESKDTQLQRAIELLKTKQ